MSTYEEKFTSSWANQKPQIAETSDERATVFDIGYHGTRNTNIPEAQELGPDAGQ